MGMPDYDPMAEKVQGDPFPYFAEFLASGCPVHHHELADVDMEKISANPLVARPTSEFWSVFAHADCYRLVQDHDRFPSGQGPGPERLTPLNGTGVLVYADPPAHTFQRRVVNKAFTPRIVAGIEPHVQAVADGLVDAFAADGAVDLVPSFCDALPGTVFSELLGVPAADRATFKHWTEEIVSAFGGDAAAIERSVVTLQEFSGYFLEIIARRRADVAAGRELPDDLLTALITSDDEGRHFEDVDLVLILHVLLVGGNETTSSGIGNAAYLLCAHQDQLQLLREDPARIPVAVEEVLRYDAPVQCMFRTTTEDADVAGVTIPADAKVRLVYGAGNRDPDVFADPDTFDVTRAPATLRRHLAFGFGIHSCVGAALARMEMRVAIETLLRRLPGLRLSATEPAERGDNLLVRRYRRLPVQWDPPGRPSGTERILQQAGS